MKRQTIIGYVPQNIDKIFVRYKAKGMPDCYVIKENIDIETMKGKSKDWPEWPPIKVRIAVEPI